MYKYVEALIQVLVHVCCIHARGHCTHPNGLNTRALLTNG